MNKNELEFEKASFASKRTSEVIGLVKHAISVSGAVYALWVVFAGLKAIVDGQSADGVQAIAKLVDSIHLNSFLAYGWGGGMTGLWLLERKGKKRAIKKKGEYQLAAESNEPNRSSSNLTDTGDTPS